MQFSFTGSLIPRVDSNGNLGIFDQNGTERVVIVGAFLSSRLNAGTYGANGLITSTGSLTYVATGDNWTYTPRVATSGFLLSAVSAGNNTLNDGVQFGYVQNGGSTTIAGGTAEAGGIDIGNGLYVSPVAAAKTQILLWQQIAGLTVGTQYTFSLCAHAVTGGTASWTTGQLAFLELT